MHVWRGCSTMRGYSRSRSSLSTTARQCSRACCKDSAMRGDECSEIALALETQPCAHRCTCVGVGRQRAAAGARSTHSSAARCRRPPRSHTVERMREGKCAPPCCWFGHTAATNGIEPPAAVLPLRAAGVSGEALALRFAWEAWSRCVCLGGVVPPAAGRRVSRRRMRRGWRRRAGANAQPSRPPATRGAVIQSSPREGRSGTTSIAQRTREEVGRRVGAGREDAARDWKVKNDWAALPCQRRGIKGQHRGSSGFKHRSTGKPLCIAVK